MMASDRSPDPNCKMDVIIVVLLMVAGSQAGFINNWDKALSYTCSSRRSIWKIQSEHSNHYEDRRWDLGCKTLPGIPLTSKETCTWTTTFVNHWDEPFMYNCPHNGYITGLYSYHSNRYEDRRWRFRCCSITGYHTQDCLSKRVNNWDAAMSFYVPSGFVLTGTFSYHSNKKEDRLWTYTYCRLKKNC